MCLNRKHDYLFISFLWLSLSGSSQSQVFMVILMILLFLTKNLELKIHNLLCIVMCILYFTYVKLKNIVYLRHAMFSHDKIKKIMNIYLLDWFSLHPNW